MADGSAAWIGELGGLERELGAASELFCRIAVCLLGGAEGPREKGAKEGQ